MVSRLLAAIGQRTLAVLARARNREACRRASEDETDPDFRSRFPPFAATAGDDMAVTRSTRVASDVKKAGNDSEGL